MIIQNNQILMVVMEIIITDSNHIHNTYNSNRLKIKTLVLILTLLIIILLREVPWGLDLQAHLKYKMDLIRNLILRVLANLQGESFLWSKLR